MYLYDFILFCEALNVDPVRTLAEILNKVEHEVQTEENKPSLAINIKIATSVAFFVSLL